MEITSRKRLMVFSGSSNEGLAREVANILGTDLGGVEREVFANSEIYIHFTESVRGADCFVIQSHVSPINYHIVEQLIMIARRPSGSPRSARSTATPDRTRKADPASPSLQS